MLVRRKKYVCTSICWTWNSPAWMRLCTNWWLGLNRRVWPHIATSPVRRGHVVEAVHDLRRGTAREVGHRAARDQPHHEFDAFAAGFAHIVDMRHGRLPLRVGDHAVQELVVEVLVDQAGPRPLQLVA